MKIKLTSFEEALLLALGGAMSGRQEEILKDQLGRFTQVARVIDFDEDEPVDYGFTEFHRTRFFKPVKNFEKQFFIKTTGALLANANVKFKGGSVNVVFKLIHGRLFLMEYHSPQKIFHPKSWESIVISYINPDA